MEDIPKTSGLADGDVPPLQEPPEEVTLVGPTELRVEDLQQPPSVSETPLEVRRETTAARLAYGLLGVFALTVLLPLLYWLWQGVPSAEVLTYVKDVTTTEIALLGVTFGFYFSQRRLGGS